jgi:cytochrome P450
LTPVFLVVTPEQISDATTAIGELRTYVDDLAMRRADDPGPDLITALLAAEAEGERLTRAETVTMIANLLVAGHDTTGSQIPCSILVALQHRDQLAGVHDDSARLASAVAETSCHRLIWRFIAMPAYAIPLATSSLSRPRTVRGEP